MLEALKQGRTPNIVCEKNHPFTSAIDAPKLR